MERPLVIVNMAATIDGKVSTSDRTKIRFTSSRDRRLMEELRAAVDGVVIGANTFREEDPPLKI